MKPNERLSDNDSNNPIARLVMETQRRAPLDMVERCGK